MNKLCLLFLVGLLGHITNASEPSEIVGEANEEEDRVSELVLERDAKAEQSVVVPNKLKAEKDPVVKKIDSQQVVIKDKLSEVAVESKEVNEVELKVKKLDKTDFKIILTEGVEGGGYIDFRKENIISWELKEQKFILQGAEYQGEISVEVGTLFGPEHRRAKVVIKDGAISSWEWIVVANNETE